MTKKVAKKAAPANGDMVTSGQVFDTRKVVNTLEGLMTSVTHENVTPDTVNAACNCADKIVDILRLHLDVERLRIKTKGRE